MSADPYISFVVTSRNDNHGDNMMHRLLSFLESITVFGRRHQVPLELIIVEWNPPPEAPRLHQVLPLQQSFDPISIRFIEVSRAIHERLENPFRIPLFQHTAKNVGIRRARAPYVVTTCHDLIFSESLFAFLAKRPLRDDVLYRLDRCDLLERRIPLEVSGADDKLAFCRRHVATVHGKDDRSEASVPTLVADDAAFLRLGDDEIATFVESGRNRSAHTNATGDFTLISRRGWMAIGGYPEIPIGDLYIDGLVVYQALAIGIEQIILGLPLCAYHINHGMTSARDIDTRKQARPVLDYADEYLPWCQQMLLEGNPLNVNDAEWGLAGETLDEITYT